MKINLNEKKGQHEQKIINISKLDINKNMQQIMKQILSASPKQFIQNEYK